MKIFKEYCEF